MEIRELKCPNCNAQVKIEKGADVCYCEYCGTKILLDGQDKIQLETKVRLRELEYQERVKELEQEIYRLQMETEQHKRKQRFSGIKTAIIMAGIVAVAAIVLLGKQERTEKNFQVSVSDTIEESAKDATDYGGLTKEQYQKVDAPTQDYIIECLKQVSDVGEIGAVTEENDPNHQLNKTGGYTCAVFFSSDLVKPETSVTSDVIERGTDGGGCLEVFRSVEDAKRREAYLATFDGGALSSGSHTIVGTVLVRTSSCLTATQQKKLESEIIEQLIDE